MNPKKELGLSWKLAISSNLSGDEKRKYSLQMNLSKRKRKKLSEVSFMNLQL